MALKKQFKLSIDGKYITEDTTFKKIYTTAKELLLAGEGKEAHITGPDMCNCWFKCAPPEKEGE